MRLRTNTDTTMILPARIFLFLNIAILLSGCAALTPDVNSLNRPLGPEQPSEIVIKEDDELQRRIVEIANEAKGKVGVFAFLIEADRTVSYNGNERFAMQSVVKLPVAMAVLNQVNEGKLNLDQKIAFTPNDFVMPGQRSPLRDKNPKGGELTVNDLIGLAVSESDGTACDILTRILGGPAGVQKYIDELGIVEMEMKRTHKEFGKNWDQQYENWASPEAAVALLESIWKTEGISPEHRELLLKLMTETPTGPNRLKGMLPSGTVVAHKTGTGGTRDGLTSATNDVGIITLPNGSHIVIAVFVGDSTADEETREAVIAKIAKAVWDTWAKGSN